MIKLIFGNDKDEDQGDLVPRLVAEIQREFDDRGYRFFTKGQYNLNIIGLRRWPKTHYNGFDDTILVVYKDDYDQWRIKSFSATTLPGESIIEQPVNSKGTAILVPGQYEGAYTLGEHKGQYPALVQQGKEVSVWRLKDGELNKDVIDTGWFGINIHKAGSHSVIVDGWSAGCQVFQMKEEFDVFMHLVNKSAELFGDRFTYTLL